MGKLILCFSSIILLNACGGSSSGISFSGEAPTGKISGESWTFGSGRASIVGGRLSIVLSEEDIPDPCSVVMNDFGEHRVIASLPDLVQKTTLSAEGQTVTLYEDSTSTNYIALQGAIEITERTSSQVAGRLNVTADGDNTVNGTFDLTFCP